MLLHNIFKAKQPIQVHCNAGQVALTHQGYLGGYPQPVWYNPHGIANIMSLYDVTKYYHVTMDSREENGFCLHFNDNSTVAFQPCSKGLY